MPDSLTHARYFSLKTFRKSGIPVATPVWFAENQGTYYCFSASKAGKVKRLRRSSQAEIAPCDIKGKLLGEWLPAQATFVENPQELESAYALLSQKYGWQMGLVNFFSKLTGRIHQRTMIAVCPS